MCMCRMLLTSEPWWCTHGYIQVERLKHRTGDKGVASQNASEFCGFP